MYVSEPVTSQSLLMIREAQDAYWKDLQSQGDVELKRNPLTELPTASAMRDELLPAYTAHWLGLIPEGPPPSATANGSPAANRGAVPKQSLIRQPIGSRLPTPLVRLTNTVTVLLRTPMDIVSLSFSRQFEENRVPCIGMHSFGLCLLCSSNGSEGYHDFL